MADKYKKGHKASWKWGSGKAEGTVEEVFVEPIEKTIKGALVKRNASSSNPAYYIKEIGKDAYVLKLHSELAH